MAYSRSARSALITFLICVSFALTACGGGGGESPPASMVQTGPGGFTPDREVVIGFPALLGGSPGEEQIARQEAARVEAMHARGGTGAGQIVGTIDGGAHLDHPDLEGKFAHICSMGNCDDGRANRPDASSQYDTNGHGTIVNGIIAARRNDVGVYGIAYEARIASYGNIAPIAYPWGNSCGSGSNCPQGVAQRDHQWSSLFDQEVARGFDWMRSLGVRVVNNSWFRTYGWSADRGLTAASVRAIMPESMSAFEAYVRAGGVAVWAAGNGQNPHPAVEAVLPRYFPDLKKGWIAVVNIGGNGHIDGGSFQCGVAAEWCIAAPGVVTSTDLGGKYNVAGGTSIAAPYVAGGLAALKSLFPNLSYQDLRTRIFATADKSGQYANQQTYGQGRLNLDAASRPVGGTNFALGPVDAGPVLPTGGARVVLPHAAISNHFRDRTLVVLDSFQRAPFEVRLDGFAEPRRSYLSMDNLALAPQRSSRDEQGDLAVVSTAGIDFQAQGLVKEDSFVGFGRGAGVMQGLADIGDILLPVSGYQMSKDAMGATLGLTDGSGRWQAIMATGAAREHGRAGFGIQGWNPETVLAVSFAPDRDGKLGADVFGVAIASDFGRPMGWDGSGALALRGDSLELAWGRNIMTHETFRVDLVSRLTHLEVQSSPLLRFNDSLLTSADIEVSFRPHPLVTVGARLGTERPVSSAAGHIRVATSVDERGRIAYQDIALDSRDFLSFDRAGLSAVFANGPNASFGLGAAAVRDGFGRTETLVGARVDVRF